MGNQPFEFTQRFDTQDIIRLMQGTVTEQREAARIMEERDRQLEDFLQPGSDTPGPSVGPGNTLVFGYHSYVDYGSGVWQPSAELEPGYDPAISTQKATGMFGQSRKYTVTGTADIGFHSTAFKGQIDIAVNSNRPGLRFASTHYFQPSVDFEEAGLSIHHTTTIAVHGGAMVEDESVNLSGAEVWIEITNQGTEAVNLGHFSLGVVAELYSEPDTGGGGDGEVS